MDLNCEIFMFKNNKVVFYGSQTGTAEEFAGRLAKEGARFICVNKYSFLQKFRSYFCCKNKYLFLPKISHF